MCYMTKIWPRPSLTASSNAAACCAWMAPPCEQNTYPTTSWTSKLNPRPAADFPENQPQNFRNPQEILSATAASYSHKGGEPAHDAETHIR